ncbi:uncharacterized protein LOC126907511 isoform X2 [Daktulosphaira vitifoliae]|uniref:uncharacterized protein LOC126907511 isoform X2 n=1 Tax=Daktulosphaira vitifoliae TaxID=58002 RepID=UPI0021AAC797|nr:uncharacterized protein LOC126907511 isoform X2 [Daktulosphaira vitifoliae]
MITIRHFICVIVYTKFSISLDPLELHCNFSKHLFNYFKHSEKYLYNFENNISELELRNYGTAVQSHGEIVMIMLDSLQEMDEEYIASDIMTINLYLNNVSGSINMIAKDKNEQLGNYEDIYRPLYFPGVNATKIKRHNSDQSSDENDEINNDDNVFDNETQSYYTPIYLVDYLLYQ